MNASSALDPIGSSVIMLGGQESEKALASSFVPGEVPQLTLRLVT